MSRMLRPFHEQYPSPWRIEGNQILDAGGNRLNHFDGDDLVETHFWQGIVDAVNSLNVPETKDFLRGIELEAAHQRFRWGADHDEGKHALDWFWLIGYLAQKAAMSAMAGDFEKAKHHTISTAAALANWHLRLCGVDTSMRPGIAAPPEGTVS